MASPLWRKTIFKEYIEKLIFTPANQRFFVHKISSIGNHDCKWDFFKGERKKGKAYYVPLTVKDSSSKIKKIEEITEEGQDKIKVHIIVGSKGNGKTVSLCQIMLDSLKNDYLPVFMDLKIDKTDSLYKWIVNSINIKDGEQAKLQNYFQAGIKFMLLLDSHSITKQKQKQTIESIKAFLQKHPACNFTIIITADSTELDEIEKSFNPITPKCWELIPITLEQALEYYENLRYICEEDKPHLKKFIKNYSDSSKNNDEKTGILAFVHTLTQVGYIKGMTQLEFSAKTGSLYKDYNGVEYEPEFDFNKDVMKDAIKDHIVRDDIVEQIEEYIKQKVRYIKLKGAAGTGKTALMSYLAITKNYPHYFIQKQEKLYTENKFISCLNEQLRKKYKIEEKIDNFRTVLNKIDDNAKKAGKQVVILIDGLDEYDRHGSSKSEEIIRLIEGNFKNITFIISSRPEFPKSMKIDTNSKEVKIEGFDTQKTKQYFTKLIATYPELPKEIIDEDFIEKIHKKSENGNV